MGHAVILTNLQQGAKNEKVMIWTMGNVNLIILEEDKEKDV